MWLCLLQTKIAKSAKEFNKSDNMEESVLVIKAEKYLKEISNDEIRSLIEFLYVIAQYQVEAEMNNSQIVVA